MNQLIRLMLEISLLKVKPQDIPASSQLLTVSVVGSFAAMTLNNLVLPGIEQAALISLTQLLLLGTSLWLLLLLTNKTSRWLQSYTALCAATALLHALSLPFAAWYGNVYETAQAATPQIIVTGFYLWLFVVSASIIKQTFEIRWLLALLLLLLLEIASASLLLRLFDLNIADSNL